LTGNSETRDEHGPEPDFDLFWPDRIGAGLGFSARPARSRIVMSKVCQLKYAMSYVRTPLSFKLLYAMIQWLYFSLYKQLKKRNALLPVGVH